MNFHSPQWCQALLARWGGWGEARQPRPANKNMKPNTKQIRRAFELLQHVFYSKNTDWAAKLLAQCKAEEKGHRGFGPEFSKYHPEAITSTDAAKLFAVSRVAQYLLKPSSFPKGMDYLHTQTSCFIAAGMVEEFQADIAHAWTGLNVDELALLDYCDYVKAEQPKVKVCA